MRKWQQNRTTNQDTEFKMSGFFSSGKVDVSRVDRSKLVAGPNNTQAVYKVRLTDFCDHLGAHSGDRSQANFVVSAGPQEGKAGAELVNHSGYAKQFMAERARGTIATILGAFSGMTRDQAGFKITNEVYQANTRSQTYNGNTVASRSREANELPLVKAGAEALLVVTPYFDKKTGLRKVAPKTGQKSVTYEFLPLSANLPISTVFETVGSEEMDAEDVPPPVENDEPAVDALALALADGWKINPNAPNFYFKKGEAKQHKEAGLRALFGG